MPHPPAPLSPEAEVYGALVTGVRDYVEKNGFGDVVFGLSGGIDSALVALVAADALGAERVNCVVMPSPHSADATQDDARAIARNLGANLIDLPIRNAMDVYEDILAESFSGREPDITEENLQARIRGNLLMALSNKFGWLVLTTGNKSEMSVGYATLYGDMAGGFAVLKDVFKLWVYRLVEWRNAEAGTDLVPRGVIERPPVGRATPGPGATRTRCRRTRSSTRSSRPTSSRTSTCPRSSRSAIPRTRSSAWSGWSTAPSTSAARRRPASASRRRPSGATGGCRSRTATRQVRAVSGVRPSSPE